MKKVFALVLALAMIFALTACGQTAPAAPAAAPVEVAPAQAAPAEAAPAEATPLMEKPIEISFSTNYKEGTVYVETVRGALERITEKTDGMVKFTLYAGGQLGKTADVMETLTNGAYVLAGMGMADCGSYVKEAAIPSYPFVVNSYEDIYNLTHSQWWDGIKAQLAEQNLIPVMYFSMGYRNICGTKPVACGDDLTGNIFRIGLGSIGQQFCEAFGCTPTTNASFADCYSEIQTGMYEFAEIDLEAMYSYAMQEVCPYISVTHHFAHPTVMFLNNEVWSQLPAEYQQILVEELEGISEELWQKSLDAEPEWVKKFQEAGCTVITHDMVDEKSFEPALTYMLDKNGIDASVFQMVKDAIAGNG